ncbi:cache domain-containing protein [Methanospirillum purgamenti]|jgi:hypothetical protein|uniref:Cache domain-containing protein n=1 Tax=Methanospirillum hungatei TaxID=2203 RepID=A0A8F5ZE64_METHU|nr:cache domain-containing protein [Methanospirillum hungatei]QXO94437.1 cache domain-containing protein [Methanospirillum hungatei]
MIQSAVSVGVIVLTLSLICASGCIAQETTPEISFTGEIVYMDLEGGFYGIISSEGTNYLPLDLSDEFRKDGLKVDVSGTIDQDVMTIQMWGQPFRINSISVRSDMPESKTWYEGQETGLSPDEKLGMTTLLLKSSSSLMTTLNEYDAEVAKVALELKGKNLQTSELDSYLEKLIQKNNGVYAASIIDRSGTIIAIYPDSHQESVGKDASSQLAIKSVKTNPVPGMSDYIETIEGEHAIFIVHPLYSSSLSVTGYLTALYKPDILVEEALRSVHDNENSILVIQPDGTIIGYAGLAAGTLFPADTNQTRNISMNDNLPIASYPAGYDMITLGTESSIDNIEYPVYWTSIFLHHNPWRILVFK